MLKIPEIKDTDLAFGKIDHMPKYKDIPQEFKDMNNKWNELFNKIFFQGVNELRLAPRQGVDTIKAMRAIQAVMRSWEPKHEHKEAACAYLFDQWFTDYSLELNNK